MASRSCFRIPSSFEGAPSKLRLGGDFVAGDAVPQFMESPPLRTALPTEFFDGETKNPAQAELGRGTLECISRTAKS